MSGFYYAGDDDDDEPNRMDILRKNIVPILAFLLLIALVLLANQMAKNRRLENNNGTEVRSNTETAPSERFCDQRNENYCY